MIMFTSERAIAKQEEIAERIMAEVEHWNAQAATYLIQLMHDCRYEYGMSGAMALITAYNRCVIQSSDEGEKKPCPEVMTPSQGTAPVETSTSARPATDLIEASPTARSIGAYFNLVLSRLLKLSANWSYRFGRWGSRGARWRKPSGNWRTGGGAALTRKS